MLICLAYDDAQGLIPGGVLKPVNTNEDETFDVTEHYWYPMLAGLSDLTSDFRPEVRNCALEVLFDLLNEINEVHDYVVEVSTNDVGLDEVLLHIHVADESTETDHRIRSYIQAKLRVSPFVHYVSEETIKKIQFNEASRKPVKSIDKRK